MLAYNYVSHRGSNAELLYHVLKGKVTVLCGMELSRTRAEQILFISGLRVTDRTVGCWNFLWSLVHAVLWNKKDNFSPSIFLVYHQNVGEIQTCMAPILHSVFCRTMILSHYAALNAMVLQSWVISWCICRLWDWSV